MFALRTANPDFIVRQIAEFDNCIREALFEIFGHGLSDIQRDFVGLPLSMGGLVGCS